MYNLLPQFQYKKWFSNVYRDSTANEGNSIRKGATNFALQCWRLSGIERRFIEIHYGTNSVSQEKKFLLLEIITWKSVGTGVNYRFSGNKFSLRMKRIELVHGNKCHPLHPTLNIQLYQPFGFVLKLNWIFAQKLNPKRINKIIMILISFGQ